jgi:uncharacterized protein
VRTLCRVDIRRSQEIFTRLDRYKERVIERLKPDAIILFGSFARQDIHQGSDVDLVVIADFRESFLDRIKLLLDLNDDPKLPLEPVGYTPEEFKRMRIEGNRFVQEVLENGKVL